MHPWGEGGGCAPVQGTWPKLESVVVNLWHTKKDEDVSWASGTHAWQVRPHCAASEDAAASLVPVPHWWPPSHGLVATVTFTRRKGGWGGRGLKRVCVPKIKP